MAQLISVRLNKSSQEPLGFRLQGGKDFGTPLVVQKVNGGSAAERAGLQAGDALIRVNTTDVYTLRHQEAQDTIRAAGAALELTVQRGGGTWKPAVTPTGSLPRPGSRPLGGTPTPVTNTSLKATPQPSRAFGSGHNNVAKPFGYMNGNDSVKGIVNKQYNTPVNMYSDKTIAETLSAQTEVLATGALGVNFKKNEKTYDAEKSAVFKVLQEEQSDPEPVAHETSGGHGPAPPAPVSGLRSVQAPITRPDAPVNNTGGLPVGQNICEECERLITGVFVRIKDKNLHVECFKCSTCGSSLKNQGYYNLNGKLYCDIHAKLVARQNPPASNLEPVTVPPGGRIPTNTYSTPLPPLATNNYSNGSSSLFSPNSNLSGPKPFGSSIGSAYSPSLSPRSAPMSPARPVTAPAPAPTTYAAPASYAPPAPAPASYAPPAPAPVSYAPPAPAPAAPFAPTNESLTSSSPHKPEFKSPAEERLIRKMAKMALNGYEIGIQRKIKPADHIQSMADKIQDTVVTKHPLNSDSLSSEENSRENTLKRAPNANIDRVYKVPDPSIISIGDKIKETIMTNHPANSNTNIVPMPPPIPSSPIPTFNLHSTPIGQPLNTNLPKKPSDFLPKNLSNNFISLNTLSNGDSKSHSGSGYSSSEDSNKDKSEGYYSDTLRRKAGFEKTSFLTSMNSSNDTNQTEIKLDNNYSNTLNKRKIFERDNTTKLNGIHTENSVKFGDKNNTSKSDGKSWNKTSVFEKSTSIDDNNISKNVEQSKKKELPNNLYDNSLYTYKSAKPEHNDDSFNSVHIQATENKETKDVDNDCEAKAESETVVRRRQKKNTRNDDGRRDSHIIARPLSTMTAGTAADTTDGVYPPICHKCDKPITRGPFITALGRIWCPEHFICVNATCRRPLQDIGFVEENGQLYCEYCFEQYIAPACDKCHAKIKGDCLNAIGKHFHPECFSCVYCGKLFGNNPFFLEDGLPYCESDWNELFTTKCFSCGFPVEAGDRWVEALNNNYHSQCFNCTEVSAYDIACIRCAKRTSRDKVSSPKEVDPSAKLMPARSPQRIIYNSDTVYSTTTFRPVSPSPITPPALKTPSPQRTRKLETPLHFEGGLFSDIRSTDGKLLSKVTVDRVHSSSHRDVTDSPSTLHLQHNNNYVDDIVKTETITNQDVITVKFTPVSFELDCPRLLTPSQFRSTPSKTPVEYIKNDFEDLQSYKIVNSLCKEKLFDSNSELREICNEKMDKSVMIEVSPYTEDSKHGTSFVENIVSDRNSQVFEGTDRFVPVFGASSEALNIVEPVFRGHSPLANILVSEQLSKIDTYLQESLDVCLGRYTPSPAVSKEVGEIKEEMKQTVRQVHQETTYHFETSTHKAGTIAETKDTSYRKEEPLVTKPEKINYDPVPVEETLVKSKKSKVNSVNKKTTGVLGSFYNMPIHYHAVILCLLLVIYNLVYQYIKQNSLGNKK